MTNALVAKRQKIVDVDLEGILYDDWQTIGQIKLPTGCSKQKYKNSQKPTKKQSDRHGCFIVNNAPYWKECCHKVLAFYLFL